MLKLPPPVWALVYVLTAATISWFFGWSKVPGLPLAPLGISLVAISWILPVWAIVLFCREGTEVKPTSPTNRKLLKSGPNKNVSQRAKKPRDRSDKSDMGSAFAAAPLVPMPPQDRAHADDR